MTSTLILMFQFIHALIQAYILTHTHTFQHDLTIYLISLTFFQ